MGNLGLSELFVIAAVGLLVIGPKRLPEVARGLGQAVRAFQRAMKGAGADAQPPEDQVD
jgi:sec-independent protein translocase protein TatA